MPIALRAAVVVVMATPAVGAVPLLGGFGGPSGYGTVDHCVHPSDNGSYAGPNVGRDATPVAIDLTTAFPGGLNLFAQVHRAFFLNTNGNITFAAPLASPDAVAYPVAGQAMVAPWWADVDTRGGGSGDNVVCYHLEPYRLVVTWHDVRAHGATEDRRNDFQMILSVSRTCTSGGLDFEFRYHRCEWASGEGGTPAQVGFDAGNRMNYVALPQSRSAAIASVCDTSNVQGGAPGLYRFQLRGGSIGAGCFGAGTPCTVEGALGNCAMGVTVCGPAGATTCARVRNPVAPRCNGLDNDCDGFTDEGPALCGDGRACDRGACRVECRDGGPCPTGQSCVDRGVCVETACLDVVCPNGQRCTQGVCVDVCDGIVCPVGTGCRLGQCENPCERVTCDGRDLCDQDARSPTFGTCVPACQCAPCREGGACLADGRCVDEACAGVTCPTGTVCRAGTCRGLCEAPAGVRLCPEDQACQAGRCVPTRDGGVDDVLDAAAVDGGVRRGGESAASGCGCRTPGRSTGGVGWAWWGVALALGVSRRRRGGGR